MDKAAQTKVINDLKGRASDLRRQNRFAEALLLSQEVKCIMEEIGAPLRSQASNLNYIAVLALNLGDLELAENAARECLRIYEAKLAADAVAAMPQYSHDNPKEVLACYCGVLAGVLAALHRFDEAEMWATRSLEHYLTSGCHTADSPYIRTQRAFLERIQARE